MNKNYINVYINLINFSRNKKIFTFFTKEDTFSDRLIIFLFHFGFFLKIYNKTVDKKKMQNVYDYIFKELESSIREIGYGDASINKKMKNYINTFYLILDKIDNWEDLSINDRENLLKNFLNYNENIRNLSDYFEKYRLFLVNNSFNSFTKGVINLKN
jgi:cytochrome b pre-mRNA-processing protein 3